MLVVLTPVCAETICIDKSLQTQDSLLSSDEMDWLREPVPSDQNQTAQPAYFSPPLAQPMRAGTAVQQYVRPAAPAMVWPNANGTMLVPQTAGYGAVQTAPMYAPAVVAGRMMPVVPAGYYPVIIIQQQAPAAPARPQAQAQTQPSTQAPNPGQPQTLSQAVSQALNNQSQGQSQGAAGAQQASKSGFRGIVDAFMGAGTTVFPSGYTGAGFTLARPVLDLILNSF